MECQGFIKVGVADHPGSRRDTLQIGNPFPINLLASIKAFDPHKEERELHQKLNQFHVRGEWFKPPQKLLQEILHNMDPDNYENPNPEPKRVQEPDPEYWSNP